MFGYAIGSVGDLNQDRLKGELKSSVLKNSLFFLFFSVLFCFYLASIETIFPIYNFIYMALVTFANETIIKTDGSVVHYSRAEAATGGMI